MATSPPEVQMYNPEDQRIMSATPKAARLMEHQGWQRLDGEEAPTPQPEPKRKQFNQSITREDVDLKPKAEVKSDDDDLDDEDADAEEEYAAIQAARKKAKK